MDNQLVGYNRRIACRPIGDRTINQKVANGFATIENKSRLIELEVVFGQPTSPDWIMPKDRVFLRGDAVKMTWAGEVFSVRGVDVILVPLDAIQLVDHNPAAPPPQPAPTRVP